MEFISFLEQRSKTFWGIAGFLLIAILGIVDYVTGVELSITLFYLIPICLVVWFADEILGLVMSGTSSITWFLTDYVNRPNYSNNLIYVWNTLIRLGFFIITTRLLSELKIALKVNQEFARVDFVTRAASVRYFYELAAIEITRQRNHKEPLSIVYFDLDYFKEINDRLGHTTGDMVLRAVAEGIQKQIRPTDTLGRLGGDEFALLLPETSAEDVKLVVNRIHTSLNNEMLKNQWMVTFSVGAVTFVKSPKSVDEMIKTADSLMYSVKTSGKNGVRFYVHAE